jgi:hypothetical protein
MKLQQLGWTVLAVGLFSCNGKGDDTAAGAADTDTDTDVDDTGEPQPYSPDIYCPGDPSGVCASNDGALHVGAAALTITPTCFEDWIDLDDNAEWDWDVEVYRDCGCDRLCEDDDGYPGADEGEGDGEFQAVWLAGFQNARPATGVHDELWARAIVVSQGDTSVAIIALDLVGLFNQENEAVRAELLARGVEVDHVVMAATHDHEGPDTVGLWGKTETRPGYDPAYLAFVHQTSADAVEAALADAREVGTMTVGAVDVRDFHETQALNVVNDRRDPKIIDTTLSAARFQDTDGETIATLIHFGSHPEAIADENTLITSDFPHTLRETVESGVTWDAYSREGLGGTAIFLNGTVGGMMTPLGVTVHTPDGEALREYTFERNDAMGRVLGEMALDAVEAGDPVAAPKLALANHRFRAFVENWGFQGMFLSGLLDRETYDWDSSIPIEDDNIPKVETEVSWIRIGDLELLSIPGELLPELAIGGYDGSQTGHPDEPIIDLDATHPPDLSQAPAGPYMLDHMSAPHRWMLGLTHDELGYIIPQYNFILDEANPWFDEAEGEHYEETNSLGMRMAVDLDEQYTLLMGWVSENGL